MPDSAADSRPASSRFETPEAHGDSGALFSSDHHGSGNGDAPPSPLPPTLTPATTTIQSVSLGVLSTLWGVNSAASVPAAAPAPSPSPSIPAIIAHAPSPDAQEPPSDLAASTGSVPSTTTTLTNTLPPTQSAALRALNAPAFQSQASSNARSKAAKSTSSRTTLSSQPVVVRTYSGSRHSPRNSSGLSSPRHHAMSGSPSQSPSALSAGLAGRTERLPSLDDFSFSAILRAVDPEIRDAIDAIAEICARSRMSLADEYEAHLPPQGEITGTGPGWAAGMGALVNRGRVSRVGQGWSAVDNTLTAVPEASSSSERLAGETKGGTIGGSKKRSQSAYGSLKSVISGGSGKRKTIADASEHAEAGPSTQPRESKVRGPAWAVKASSPDHPAITIVTSPQASKQLSLDTSSTIKDIPKDAEDAPAPRPQTAIPRQMSSHRRNTSLASLPASQTRSGTLSSLASWFPWPRPHNLDSSSQQELTKAEARLREMLTMAQESNMGKGKAPLRVA
ncbi:hypothetical protein K458DRAFT_417224 [Lentithecium fluviatile CBS 122367]|uniref:Uncharacterized protein n=1 Tax=Lentithecium fluviatile CBS 122367 TaxID=1168545 RepID=A0A6G1J4K6_9PLEO|nr:hypothetical protein K458DRAFT_417224 [Lentithecium fluviatile CBS 122367]